MSNRKSVNFEERDCMTHRVEAWTDDLDEFLLGIQDGDWFITNRNRLLHTSEAELLLEEGEEVRESIHVGDDYHTTHRLRQFCAEFHSEVDFDSKFETHRPGVFARYQDQFGYDYEDWTRKEIYRELKETLVDRGYHLHFKETKC